MSIDTACVAQVRGQCIARGKSCIDFEQIVTDAQDRDSEQYIVHLKTAAHSGSSKMEKTKVFDLLQQG